MRQQESGTGRQRLISASEIACWAYCPEQWRLRYGLELPADNAAALRAGTRHHARKAIAERVAGFTILLGRFLVVLAGLGALWLLWR